ncbi:MAG: HAD family hydrolase [Bdellovibrionales bacterium]
MRKELIIFDCDGTLVNSELLYNTITSDLLNELGFKEYTPQRCIELFAGQSWSTIKAKLEEMHGAVIPEDIVSRYIKIANDRMEKDLEAAPHALDVVGQLSVTHTLCVASNGERGNVIKSLSMTGLIAFFQDDHIFTKIQVPRPKPAPDLFLFTTQEMGFEPSQCIVIEDSPAGVEAAVAAGIDVIAYTGCAHDHDAQAELLRDAGASVVVNCLTDII